MGPDPMSAEADERVRRAAIIDALIDDTRPFRLYGEFLMK